MVISGVCLWQDRASRLVDLGTDGHGPAPVGRQRTPRHVQSHFRATGYSEDGGLLMAAHLYPPSLHLSRLPFAHRRARARLLECPLVVFEGPTIRIFCIERKVSGTILQSLM